MEFDDVYTIKQEHTKEEFLRKLLIELASSSETPIDVVNASFDEIKVTGKEIVLCKGHVETDYFSSIGYDRKEEYWRVSLK